MSHLIESYCLIIAVQNFATIEKSIFNPRRYSDNLCKFMSGLGALKHLGLSVPKTFTIFDRGG